jgi:hypothetical protein
MNGLLLWALLIAMVVLVIVAVVGLFRRREPP